MSPALWVAIIGGSATIIASILTALFTSSPKQEQKQEQNQLNNQSTVVNVNLPKTDSIKSKPLQDDQKIKIIASAPNKSKKDIDTTPKVSQHGKNNLVIGGNNTGNVNVGDTYNKPPQRHLTENDLQKIISAVTAKDMRIKICSDGSKEGATFKNEILKALTDKGYFNLSDCTIGMSYNTWKDERITIRQGEYNSEKYLEVLLNPQE